MMPDLPGGKGVERPSFETYPHRVGLGRRRRWGWRLTAGNGEQVAQGQGYLSRDVAETYGLAVADGVYSNPVVYRR